MQFCSAIKNIVKIIKKKQLLIYKERKINQDKGTRVTVWFLHIKRLNTKFFKNIYIAN